MRKRTICSALLVMLSIGNASSADVADELAALLSGNRILACEFDGEVGLLVIGEDAEGADVVRGAGKNTRVIGLGEKTIIVTEQDVLVLDETTFSYIDMDGVAVGTCNNIGNDLYLAFRGVDVPVGWRPER